MGPIELRSNRGIESPEVSKLQSAQAELISHRHHLAVAEVDFDELGPADRLAIFIL